MGRGDGLKQTPQGASILSLRERGGNPSHEPQPANTYIGYLYRDAENYKSTGHVIVSGRMTDVLWKRIEKKLDSINGFIPEQVGFEPLQAALQQFDTEPNDADHPWHELTGWELTDDEVTDPRSVDVIVEQFESVSSWDDDSDSW